MADLVVGLAKSVVDGVLTKAQAAIEEEAKLRKSAQRDLVFITGEFQMMQSFLNVANEERVENKVVRTWVSQVRELAYDVEDCIEFVIHLDKKTAWWFRVLPSWMIPPPWCSCVIPSCMAPAALALALKLEQAVDEIEQVKARVADVSKRNARYNLISDSGSKPAVMHHHPSSGGGASGAAASNMLVEARDAARRRQRFGDLSRLITKRNDDLQLQVISVWGAGGDHGTISTIRKAYNDPEICRNFDCRAWVKLVHPFNPHELVRGFMAQVYANSFQEQGGAILGRQVLSKMEATQDNLLKDFEDHVTKRYLVVLEDLSDMVEWDAARTFLPDKKNGSCIIVSAQQSEMASMCIGYPYQILELKQFSPEHSVCALFKKDSQGHEDKDKKTMGSDGDGYKGKKVMTREESHVSSYDNILPPKKKTAEEWMKNYPLIGRNTQMTELGKYPAKARTNSNPVMSVWGIAGVGKSAVVRNLYYDRMLHDLQFQKYGWVDVSHPFNLRDFYRSLLLEFHSEKYPIEEYCHNLVRIYRCLIVIDGLQSTEEWDLIQASLVPRSSRSVIIVITTDASIAKYCTNNEDHLVFNVKALEDAAALDLFKSQVYKRNPSSSLKVHGVLDVEELIRRCGGLPKVIAAIAGLMATQTVTLMETVRSLNRKFMHHLETNPEYDSLRDLFHWMHSYFRTCPDSLKPCIIYLAIFPRDRIIRRRRLVRRWIAEGYSRDSHNESAEENGEDQFSDLLELSIIQQAPHLVTTAFIDTRMVLCQVNGFIREYIVSRQIEDNLVFELGGKCSLTTQRTGRHLTVLEDWTRDIIVFESIDFSRLRSLTVFGEWESFFISASMKMLRVLDLEDAKHDLNDSDLEKMVEHLCRLKFLSLRGHHEISRLPTSLGCLRHLQTLDVRHTSIAKLPASITELYKLQYIRAGTTDVLAATSGSSWLPSFCGRHHLVGVVVPRGIGKLTALHTLGVVNVSASGGKAMVKELKKLTQLRKLEVSGINRHNSNKFFSAISEYGHLESLSVLFDKESKGSLDDIVLPWLSLQRLKLYGLQDKLPLSKRPLPENVNKSPQSKRPSPENVNKSPLSKRPLPENVNKSPLSKCPSPENVNKPEDVTKLTKLNLEMDTLMLKDIEFLAKLPKLCILRLHVNKQDSLKFYAEMYGFELRSFEKVKILKIACSSGLQLTFGSETMKILEVLKLDYSLPEDQLPHLSHLPELKEVLLKVTNNEATKTALQIQLANHPKKPVVKYFVDKINLL